MTAGVDGHAQDQSTRLKNIMEHRQCYNEPFIPPSGIFGHESRVCSLSPRLLLGAGKRGKRERERGVEGEGEGEGERRREGEREGWSLSLSLSLYIYIV